jgi:hypothetical protein
MPDYVTVTDVELVSAGIDWPSATGPTTITMDHVADAVRAANDDPLILDPRIKLGHSDPRFNSSDELDHMWDPTWDGEPAFGRAVDLRLTEDGAVIVGDLVGIPDWLTETDDNGIRRLAVHYPSRSIEPLFDWTTPGQRTYRMVIAAVALLGDRWPACQDIEDLALLVTDGPDAVHARHAEQQGVSLALPATSVSLALP